MRTDPEPAVFSPPSDEAEDPSSTQISLPKNGQDEKHGFLSRMKFLFTGRQDRSDLREAIEEYIEEPTSFESDPISTHERILFSNILNLRDITVFNVMIPRADIIGIDVDISKDDLFALLSEKQFSRFPVFKGTLDEVVGTVHIKDIVASIAQGKNVVLKDMVSEVPVVSPSMPILDLVLKMRHSRRHMALVVDEFGGIDGLVTIGDVIETIIGEVDDEHDIQNDPKMIQTANGVIVADARVGLSDFEDRCGAILNEEERQESDTLGGLVFDFAGRVPVRGEIITHSTGMVFEILDGDTRRINSIKISNIPDPETIESQDG